MTRGKIQEYRQWMTDMLSVSQAWGPRDTVRRRVWPAQSEVGGAEGVRAGGAGATRAGLVADVGGRVCAGSARDGAENDTPWDTSCTVPSNCLIP